MIAQRFESAHATFIASAARFDAFANPDFFLRPEFVELAVHHFFGGELLALARLVRREVAGVGTKQAAIELDDARRDAIQKRAVVGDDDGRRSLDQEFFQRRDAVDVQMVGGLVEQQQVGFNASANASAARLRSPPEVVSGRARPRRQDAVRIR